MILNQFLKPDWRKILLMIIVTILFYYTFGYLLDIDKKACSITELSQILIAERAFCDTKLIPLFFLTEPIVSIIGIQGIRIVPFEANILFIIIQLPYYYLLSCIIVWIYDKLRKKK